MFVPSAMLTTIEMVLPALAYCSENTQPVVPNGYTQASTVNGVVPVVTAKLDDPAKDKKSVLPLKYPL